MKIYLVAHFCSDFSSKGNNRFNYLASLLAKRKNDVVFFTTDFSHVKKSKRITTGFEVPYKINFIHESGYKKNVSMQRIISHRMFSKNLANNMKHLPLPDVVYLSIPSIDAAYVTAKYCIKRNIPYILDIQDLWPEAFQLVLRHADFLFWGMKRKVDYIYKNASELVAVSETYLERAIRARNDKCKSLCVYLGTDLKNYDSYPVHQVMKKQNELWIVYIGTLGASYNIGIVIDAVKLLVKRGISNFSFQVFGDGPNMQEFKNLAKGLPVHFWGRLLYEDMIGYVKNGDIAVNPIVKGAAQSIINKHADYAAAGLPIVNTQECIEYRNLLDHYKCGINCDVDSVDQVANALQFLIENPADRVRMGKNSRLMAEEVFDRSSTYQQIVDDIERS